MDHLLATHRRPIWLCLLLLCLVLTSGPATASADAAAPAVAHWTGQSLPAGGANWCLAGGFQGWNNASHPMNDDGLSGDLVAGDGLYSLDFIFPAAGRDEWKVVECGNWGNAYPANNSWVYTTAANQTVKFTFDTNDHSGDAGAVRLPLQNVVNAGDDLPASFTAVGDFQNPPWNNSDPATAMTYVGRGLYHLVYSVPAAGAYQGKVTQTGSWNEQFGGDGRSVNSATVSFTTTASNELVVFLLDGRTGRLTIAPNGSGAANWCVAGAFNGWNNASDPLNDNGVAGDLLGGDGLYSLDYTVATAGRHEWKIVECGNWGNAYPIQNAWLNTGAAGQVVKFTFDSNNHASDAGLDLLPSQNIVNAWDDLPPTFNAVGDFETPPWTNNDPATDLTSLGNGWHLLGYAVPTAGNYLGKITTSGSWDAFGGDGRSIDAQNLAFQVYNDGDQVQFLLDSYDGRLAILAPPPPPGSGDCASGASPDDNVWWNELGHDSRDTLFRYPGGAVVTGTAVTLRFRAACDDLTAVRVRVWDDRVNVQTIYNMSRVAHDTLYDWWQVTLPPSADPTIYWYRFMAIDGTATAYYEDDAGRTGGWGQTYASSPDNGWQLTIYDPAFQTPDWVKNAVIYQIFPDRFRDGDPANNTPAGSFFYNEPGGTIVRSNQSDWNRYICDPRNPADCPGTYSKNFYGGDLQGIIDQLDYLQELGVTAIYLNPIFESPSNHKYDTTDFSLIDDNFGTLATFQTLSAEAGNRGIGLILDGVFNHTSSDSIYFDRYERYPAPDGGCESLTSPYRDWYYFQPAPVPGTGPCAGDTVYTSWFGFDSLPKLNASVPAVRDLIWSGGPDSIGRYWMQWADGWRLDVAGDVDPGATNDPTNDYWEGFRAAIHATNPDAYIVGEEWNIATAWTLGQEWDATMNYQFSSAILSFWRDTPFVDNDHNSASSAGVLNPLSPSQLDERLRNLAERYPPPALYAMMNLLGSHDTNRPLFMLDHNTYQNNSALYLDPNYDWSDAIQRLRGVAILQFTLPGAPTVYYGDEVGLVGPVTYDGSTWQDDPYNRQPFPWLDETGAPFYAHLQSQASQDALGDYYALLIGARNSHPALRTGSFETLLVDDAGMIYAYGRKMADHSDAAVVVVNRGGAVRATVTLDVTGYLPVGAQFLDVLDNNAPYSVDGSGQITLDVPSESGAILVLSGALALPPDPVTGLAVTDERSEELDLAWNAAAGADSYDIYRSLVSGGGYEFVANTAGSTHTDSGLSNAVRYYYVVVSRDDTTLLTGGNSNEASGVPHHDLTTAWYNLQWPPQIVHTISAVTPTETIYGQLWIDGATGPNGPATGITAQVGYGISGTLPTDPAWLWSDMSFHIAAGNNDEYQGNLLPDLVGDYHYVTRWSSDGGETWYYSDLAGPGMNGQPGVLFVIPGDDTTAPAAPQNLTLQGTTAGSISMSWDPNAEPDLAGYEIYRQSLTESGGFVRIAQVGPGVTAFTDETVTTGQTYEYYVLAYDTSFNRSAPSNSIEATAEPRIVAVTFNVTVPEHTPGVVYVVGNQPEIGNWDPGAVPMSPVNPTTWTIDRSFLDGTALEFKFTRGNWETVEKEADGNTEIPNRTLVVDYGPAGTQVVDLEVANWRDPFVVSHVPAAGAANVPVNTPIQVTWNQAMPETASFAVTGPEGAIGGAFSYDGASYTVTFTPDDNLAHSSTYTVTVVGQSDVVGDVQQGPVSWNFNTFVPTSVSIADFSGDMDSGWREAETAVKLISLLIIAVSIAGLAVLRQRGRLT